MELIYTIPGLGTTEELFAQIAVPNFKLQVLRWPEPKPGQTLKEYAREFIGQIDTRTPVNLMGVSFGGMLCSEIAESIATRNIILISSCKSRKELPPNLRMLKTLPVQRIVNDRVYRSFASRLCGIVGFKKDYLPQFKKMMNAMPENYFRYCVDMIIRWDRQSNSKAIYHIHGSSDRLLPHHYIKNFQEILKGNHAMIVYRAQEINQLLNTQLNGL